MSKKHFSFLLGLTLAVAVLVLLVPGRTGKEAEFDQTLLLPGLQDQVNDLDWLRFTGAGGATIATLRRSGNAWRVEEADGYGADWERLRTLLADLARAKVVEPKTANPEYYDRLGVEDVTLPDAGGTQVGFPEGSGLPAVIVGNRAQGRSGQYVRLGGVAESALIDREMDLPSTASEWLDQAIVDISDSEVVEVEIRHSDGERVAATRASADDQDFVLQNIPEGREIRSAWTVNSLANSLSSLTLEAVAKEGTVDWSETTRFSLVTVDGLRIDVDLASAPTNAGPADGEGDSAEPAAESAPQHWIRLQASLYRTAVGSAVEAAAGAGEAATEGQAEEQAEGPAEAQGGNENVVEEGAAEPDDGTTTDDPAERARQINQRVSGWAYRIPQYKFESMNKRMEDLLKAAEDSNA